MSNFTDTQPLSTLKDFIRWSASEFLKNDLYFGHGFSSALDEAVYACLFALKLPHDWPSFYFDTHLLEDERKAIYELIQLRVKSRLPMAYLTNEAWFCDLKFYIDARVLVPRSPFAELIKNQFEPWVDPNSVNSILDLCTGSACIAIACQYAFPDAQVSASDISKDALEVAQKNCQQHQLDNIINLIESDGFNDIPTKSYDLIVSNPPYVDAEDLANMPLEFHQEPSLGLASGNDGLDLTFHILQQAPHYLSEHGVLMVEVGNSAFTLDRLLPNVPFQWVEFEHGGSGVFYLSASDLKNHKKDIDTVINSRNN